ncbi:MAG: membrane protein insertase YidC [Spirochaetes bacterium]|nr:membrane protein insertase YidC [Spirochaetota bacterium]
MDKKSLIAIILIGLLWGGYFIIFKPEQPKKKAEAIKTETKKQEPAEKAGTAPAPVSIVTYNAGGAEKQVTVQTKKLDVTLSTRGAAVSACRYKERNVDLTVRNNPFGARGTLDFALHFDDDEFLNSGGLEQALWNYRGEGNTVTFSSDVRINNSPVRIEKTYTFPEDGLGFTIEYRIINRGGSAVVFKNGEIIVSPGDLLGPELDYSNTYNRLMSIYSLNGSFKKADKKGGGFLGCGSSSGGETLKKESGKIDWAGIMSRYFLVIMIPEGSAGKGVVFDNRKQAGFRTGMYVEAAPIAPGKEFRKTFKVYLGEKDKKALAATDKSIIDAADINKLIEPIRKFVIWCLLSINKLVGNLGWALVIFSLLSKAVFMPLTIKSTESMKKMQQLTPKLNELKVKYKDKPDQMQKEMMKLYRENKVNPMGGCFPLLLQMPFFFALYSALIDSIDLWRAPFILWMKDLSMPDTVLTISGFDLNILPIIMTASTFLQQKLTTVDTGGQQKVMMMMMPLVFIFIFWSMPSGLVLYWALQNIFQIAHQLFINYRSKGKEAA